MSIITNVLILLLVLSSLPPAAGELALVPWPDSIELRGGKPFRLERTIRILYGTREEARPIEQSLQPLAEVLAGELELITGIKPASPFRAVRIDVARKVHSVDVIRMARMYKIRVDLGAPDQFLQFDWTAWNGADNEASRMKLNAFGGIAAAPGPASPDGILRWLGEMNVIGKYGFAYGDGVMAIDKDGLLLEFAGRPKGLYKLRTWHHAPRSNTDSMDPNRERLKAIQIHKLPYAKELAVAVSDAGGNATLTAPVTEGKEMQFAPVAVAEMLVESDGRHPVQVRFKDPLGKKGVWLNAFELSEWDEDLMN